MASSSTNGRTVEVIARQLLDQFPFYIPAAHDLEVIFQAASISLTETTADIFERGSKYLVAVLGLEECLLRGEHPCLEEILQTAWTLQVLYNVSLRIGRKPPLDRHWREPTDAWIGARKTTRTVLQAARKDRARRKAEAMAAEEAERKQQGAGEDIIAEGLLYDQQEDDDWLAAELMWVSAHAADFDCEWEESDDQAMNGDVPVADEALQTDCAAAAPEEDDRKDDDVEENEVAGHKDLRVARMLDDGQWTAAEIAWGKAHAAEFEELFSGPYHRKPANVASPSKTTESDQHMTSLKPDSSVPDKAKVKPIMGQCSQCGKHIFVSAKNAVGTCFHCRKSITDEATSVTDEPPVMHASLVSLDPRPREATRPMREEVGVRRRLFPPSLPRGGASSSLEEALSTSIEPAVVQESALSAKKVPRKAKRSFREDEEELRRDDQGLPATTDEVQFLGQRSVVPDDDVVYVGRKSLPPAEVRSRRIAAVVRREAAVWADGVPWPSPPPSPKGTHAKRLRIAHDEEVFREVRV
ncbi:hypothetical protein LTR22_010395 [Elasticomyces elasticus]|nr:hypothetical protein LTR22_010395 [Elasticomyces elasticus]